MRLVIVRYHSPLRRRSSRDCSCCGLLLLDLADLAAVILPLPSSKVCFRKICRSSSPIRSMRDRQTALFPPLICTAWRIPSKVYLRSVVGSPLGPTLWSSLALYAPAQPCPLSWSSPQECSLWLGSWKRFWSPKCLPSALSWDSMISLATPRALLWERWKAPENFYSCKSAVNRFLACSYPSTSHSRT